MNEITISLGERAEIVFDRGPTPEEIDIALEAGRALDPRPSLRIGGVKILMHRGQLAAIRETLNKRENRL